MQYRTQNRRRTAPAARRSRVTLPVVVVISAALLAAAVAGMAAWNAFGGETTTAASSPAAVNVFKPDGTPISEEPVRAAGVEVPEPAVNLGRVAMKTPVQRVFRLRNTSTTPVALGRARIEVLQGCCPEDPILKATTIEPGQEVPLVFSQQMGMHEGMGGPHLFRVTVPVQNGGEYGTVELFVKADYQ